MNTKQLTDTVFSFNHVLTSPLKRARHTCELASLSKQAEVDADLMEWDNGDYESQTPAEIVAKRPGWNLFRDGCPNGEMPEQISARADRLSILCYEHDRTDQPAIELRNSAPLERFVEVAS